MASRQDKNVQDKNAWMGSYAVLMTLLFGLFVVLYASSRAMPAKKPAASSSSLNSSSAQILGTIRDALSPEAITQDAEKVDSSAKIGVSEDERGLVVRIQAKNFFDEGKAAVDSSMLPILDRVGKVLREVPNKIRIEGYIDAQEASSLGSQYESGWEFSSARAAWVARYFVQHLQFAPERLSVAGFSSYHPSDAVARQDGSDAHGTQNFQDDSSAHGKQNRQDADSANYKDAWSRSRDRRVEFVILK